MSGSGTGRRYLYTWSRMKLGGKNSASSGSIMQSNHVKYISDIQSCIIWGIYQIQFSEWIVVTILPVIFWNSFIWPTWKRHINLPTKSITFSRCSSIITTVPVMTISRRHCHVLHFKSTVILTLQMISIYYPLLINHTVHTEPICLVWSIIRTSPFSTLCRSSCIISEKCMLPECAKVLN